MDDGARGARIAYARRRAVLGRFDIGSLEPGKCADFFSLDLHTIALTPAQLHDPLAADVSAPRKALIQPVINGKSCERR